MTADMTRTKTTSKENQISSPVVAISGPRKPNSLFKTNEKVLTKTSPYLRSSQ